MPPLPVSVTGVQKWPMRQYFVSYMAPNTHKIWIILVIIAAFNQLASWSQRGNFCFAGETF